MLSTGPPGFHNAPISKGLLLMTVAASILVSVTQLRDHFSLPDLSSVLTKFQLWRLLTSHLFFTSPGEVLFGSILIYMFRMFERQMGSVKFAGFTFMSMLISTLMQIPLFVTFYNMRPLTPGPYSFIFACLVQFYFDVPATYRFRVCGILCNDKLFTYILGLQLMMTNGFSSVLAAICGILSGLAYRSDSLGLSKFQFPAFINNFFSRFILPMMQSPVRSPPRNPIQIQPSSARQAQANPFPAMQQPNGTTQGFADQLIPGPGFGGYPFGGMGQPFPSLPVRAPQPPSEESIQALTSMGFSRDAVVQALQQSHNDMQAATNILLDSMN